MLSDARRHGGHQLATSPPPQLIPPPARGGKAPYRKLTTASHLLRMTIAGAAGALVYIVVLGPYPAAIGMFAIPFITAAGSGLVRRWNKRQNN